MYSIHVSRHSDGHNKLLACISSLCENTNNLLEVVEVDLENKISHLDKTVTQFPASKIMWSPKKMNYGDDFNLLASSSDKLRLFSYDRNNGIKMKTELKNTLLKDLSAPLTSFDWAEQTNYICCSSIDTTCSIFDINSQKFYKQLIAHDKEVCILFVEIIMVGS